MELQHGLNILDYSVLGVVLLSGLLALMRGFVREVLSLAAWVGAYAIAANGYIFVEPWAHKYIKNQTGSIALASVIVFVVALTVLTLAGYFISKLVRGRTLTAIDRSLGFLFGLGRGVLIVCLVYLGATYIPWLNMDKLDTAHAQPQIQVDAGNQAKPDEKDKDKDKPPEWLVEAKTRPALATGADMLRVFIPEKVIEKTMKEYDEQAAAAHRAAAEKTQDILSMPGKPPEKKDEAPAPSPAPPPASSYDDKSRSNLDHLIEQKSNP